MQADGDSEVSGYFRGAHLLLFHSVSSAIEGLTHYSRRMTTKSENDNFIKWNFTTLVPRADVEWLLRGREEFTWRSTIRVGVKEHARGKMIGPF